MMSMSRNLCRITANVKATGIASSNNRSNSGGISERMPNSPGSVRRNTYGVTPIVNPQRSHLVCSRSFESSKVRLLRYKTKQPMATNVTRNNSAPTRDVWSAAQRGGAGCGGTPGRKNHRPRTREEAARRSGRQANARCAQPEERSRSRKDECHVQEKNGQRGHAGEP